MVEAETSTNNVCFEFNYILSYVGKPIFLISPIRYHYLESLYRVGNDLNPPSSSQSQLQQPKKIYTYKVKI